MAEDNPDTAGGGGSEEGARSRLSELGQYIRTQRNHAQLSLRHLAKLAGVSNPYLSQIERGLRKPSAEILQAIAKALEISSETLYVKAGILEERPGEHDVVSAINRDAHLTEQQRAALIEMYRSFKQLHDLQGASGGQGRKGVVGSVIEAVSTGDVDDEAIAAASLRDEDEQEA